MPVGFETQLKRTSQGSWRMGHLVAGEVSHNQDNGDDYAFIPMTTDTPQKVVVAAVVPTNTATPVEFNFSVSFDEKNCCPPETETVCFHVDGSKPAADIYKDLAIMLNGSGYFGGGTWVATAADLAYNASDAGQDFTIGLEVENGTATIVNTPSVMMDSYIPAGAAVVHAIGKGYALPGICASETFAGIALKKCSPIRVGCNGCEQPDCDPCLRVRLHGEINIALEVEYKPECADKPPVLYYRNAADGAFTQKGLWKFLANDAPAPAGMVKAEFDFRLIEVDQKVAQIFLT